MKLLYLNAIGTAAELAGRAAAALRVGAARGGSAVGTAPELGVLAAAALLKSMMSLNEDLLLYTVWRSLGYLKCVGLLMKLRKCSPAGLELTTQQQLCQNSSPI